MSSSAFDRKLEKEADIEAVKYLENAHVNPKPFANFLFRLGNKSHEFSGLENWLSTHPNSKERATYISESKRKRFLPYQSVISSTTWDKMIIEIKKSIISKN